MRLAIEIDDQVYDFYKEIFKDNSPQPRERTINAMIIFDTETREWTWAFLDEAPRLNIDLLYAAPNPTNRM